MRNGYYLCAGLLGTLLLVASLSSTPVVACTCTSLPTFEEAVQNSDAIFLGTVVGIDPVDIGGFSYLSAVMISSSWWKGELAGSVRVLTEPDPSVCGFPFEVGHEYLVYAVLDHGDLWAGLCWRTHETWPGDPDVAALGPPQVVPTLAGTWSRLKATYR